jgi:hypothetical protein
VYTDGNDGNDYFIIETYDENKRAKKMYIFPHNLFLFLSFLSFSSENTQWNGLKTMRGAWQEMESDEPKWGTGMPY